MNKEHQLEENLIKQLTELKYNYRPDIIDRKTLEQNFKTKFEKEDNKQNPEEKKAALKIIIDNYNKQYGTNQTYRPFRTTGTKLERTKG